MSRLRSSPYIEWAKLSSAAPVNLATSGVPHATLADLGAGPEHFEMISPGGYGYAPLTERIAAKHGVAPARVVTAEGTSMANYLAMAAIVEPGDEVVIERPTYEPLLNAASFLGADLRRIDRRPEDDFRLDPDAVRRAMSPRTRLVVLANLHNPSGNLVTRDALKAVGDAAAAVGARVLVDEVYLDAVFDAPQASCVHLGPHFVSTNSLTKVYGLSGLRCGWILADEALARRMWRLNDLFGNVAAHPAERLSVLAFDRLPRLLARSRALLEENRRQFADTIGRRADVAIARSPVGTTVCLRPLRVPAERLTQVLRERHQTAVVPGRFFELPDHVRVSLCAPPETSREGFARLAAALDGLSSAT